MVYSPNLIDNGYNYKELKFEWFDGVFGTSLFPVHMNADHMLFYHPTSSHTEVPTSVL